ncbi:mediator of RNA polymerase II transcription subunit 30 [Scaptodrosophila lebanonensis]|uniref:Mediator of RNA polymerase II transcription subunit 30 n=1 Tax=Drosophila lebanonensis TaxID=7225 RepID=A0A6J2TBL5_DROLE|nr:mediator of RNA polymerase II transcription subunit 30 [Scaptodrosophila lebanonensis]
MWKYGQNQGNQGAAGGGGGPNMMPMGGFVQGGGAGMPHGNMNMQQMHMTPQQQQQQQMNMMGPGPGGMQMNPGGPPGLMQGMSPQHPMQQQQQMMQGGVGVGVPMSQQAAAMQQHLMGGPQGVGMGVGGPQQQQQQQQQQAQQQHQQQQQQQSNPQQQNVPGGGAAGGGTGNNMLAISQPNPHKEINIVQLSRLGQETVQDIASRFQEVFSALKNIQPTSHRENSTEKKVQEYFRTIRLLFKRVRIIYEKCNDAGMDYMNAESLIPYKDEPDLRIEPSHCDEYRKVVSENQELIETVKLKNRQLREIIDRTRIIIWEINTMLAMRRS